MVTLDWSTDPIPVTQRFDAWQGVLSQSHLDWRLDPADREPMSARVRSHRLGDASLIECRSSACGGQRARQQVARDAQAFFGLLYVRAGREWVRDAHGEHQLGAGDLLFWDSRRTQDFRILESLDKLTLLIPQARLDAVLPRADAYAGTVLRGPLARWVRGSLETLLEVCDDLDAGQVQAATDLAIQGLAHALLSVERGASKSSDLPAQLLAYIEQHLQDERLCPAGIAKAHGISVRYLHLLFARQDLTVSRWIKHRRLQRCRAELRTQPQVTITEIAHRWGFGDAAQFSRTFRGAFGCSPRVYRKNAG